MNLVKEQAIIEAMLFSTGREVKIKEIMNALELGSEDIEKIMQNMKLKYEAEALITMPSRSICPCLCAQQASLRAIQSSQSDHQSVPSINGTLSVLMSLSISRIPLPTS